MPARAATVASSGRDVAVQALGAGFAAQSRPARKQGNVQVRDALAQRQTGLLRVERAPEQSPAAAPAHGAAA
jgi:hypothetical protein